MDNDNVSSGYVGWIVVTLSVLAAVSASVMFGQAWIHSGLAESLPQINSASDANLWVKAVFWDITLFNMFVCAWIFYREPHWWCGVIGTVGFWATGSVFLGLYIAVLWVKTRSFKRVLLGKHYD